MHRAASRSLFALLALALALAGCGKSSEQAGGGGPAKRLDATAAPGAVSVATRNTTRLGGPDVATDAAAVARAVYPGLTAETRPGVVVIVNEQYWSAALAASSLASAPTTAPLLYSEGQSLPEDSRESLEAMHPTGDSALAGVQVIEIGASPKLPGALLTKTLPVGEPATTAASIEHLLATADGGAPPHQVIVLAADTPRALEMPAAGLAAESGAPILFVNRSRVPTATVGVLRTLDHPSIYVIDAGAVGHRTLAQLGRLGTVTAITTEAGSPVANSIAVARFTDGTFGWGVKEPGHGLAFANLTRPLDAPAAAPLSATGDYAPLLLLEHPAQIPTELAGYLSDIQPAYTTAPQFRPVRGVYNHGWLIGDEQAISSTTQAEVDSLLEISPRHQSAEEATVTQAE